MAFIRKSLDQLRSEQPVIDQRRIAETTDADIHQHAIEDGENPDATTAKFDLLIPAHVVRRKLGMSQAAFASLLKIPVGTIRMGTMPRAARSSRQSPFDYPL